MHTYFVYSFLKLFQPEFRIRCLNTKNVSDKKNIPVGCPHPTLVYIGEETRVGHNTIMILKGRKRMLSHPQQGRRKVQEFGRASGNRT